MIDGMRNAIINSVVIDDADRDMLTAWLHLDYDSGGQGFGGHRLDGSKAAAIFIKRCMEVGGVTAWHKLPGKAIRVDIKDGLIEGIGHIIKDDWFYPKKEFKDL